MVIPIRSDPDLRAAVADAFVARGDDEVWQLHSRLSGITELDPFARDGVKFSDIGVAATERLATVAERILTRHPGFLGYAHDAQLTVVHEGAGVTATPAQLVMSTFTAALQQMHYLGQQETESQYVDLVAENLAALHHATRGGTVNIYEVVGLAGLYLPVGRTLRTPWGEVRGVNRSPHEYAGLEGFQRAISVVLCVPRPVTIPISTEPVPQIAIGPWKTSGEAEVLSWLALAFILAESTDPRTVPVAVWSTTLHPFASGIGYSIRRPLVASTWPPTLDEPACARVEDWCRLLDARRHLKPGVFISGRRLVSAVSGRTDLADSLVDAVVAWENLVGAEGETTFRVTAALTKLIEDEPAKRAALFARLKRIYALRSRAVHGTETDPLKLKDAVEAAIGCGVAGLQRLYLKDDGWFKLDSTARANRLLLEEP